MKRFEYKYLIHRGMLPDLRRMLTPFVAFDSYARTSGGEYTVRSIYFDTPRLDNFYQKIEGVKMRKKLRVRGYNMGGPESTVFLEIKRRYGVPIAKNRAPVRYADLVDLLCTGDIDRYVLHDVAKDAADDASRFLFNLERYSMRPVINVAYEREAYVGRLDPTIRVTFDKNLRSVLFPDLENLFTDASTVHVFKQHFILEIKFFGAMMPVWGRTLVRRLGVHQRALSKYTLGVKAHGAPPSFARIVALSRVPSPILPSHSSPLPAPEALHDRHVP